MAGTLGKAHPQVHHRIGGGTWERVRRSNTDIGEEIGSVERQLTAVQLPLSVELAPLQRHSTEDHVLVYPFEPHHLDITDRRPRSGIHLEMHPADASVTIDVEVPEHLGGWIAAIGQPGTDRISGCEQQEAIERCADLEWEPLGERHCRDDLLVPCHDDGVHPNRLALHDEETDANGAVAAADERIDHCVRESRLTVERHEP